MKICVLSGRYPASEFLSAENHRIYCDYHNYYYINCSWPTRAKNPYLNKFYFLKQYIDLFDFIFWIDDDAFFIDIEKPLSSFIPDDNRLISICNSPSNKKIWTMFSSGSFMISSKFKQFVDSVINTDLDIVKKWWTSEHGYFTNGDQDIMVYLYLNYATFHDKFKLFDHNAFNSRMKDLEENASVFLVHLTGPIQQKRNTYKKLQAHLSVGKTLLPDNVLEGYKILDSRHWGYKLKIALSRLFFSGKAGLKAGKKKTISKHATNGRDNRF